MSSYGYQEAHNPYRPYRQAQEDVPPPPPPKNYVSRLDPGRPAPYRSVYDTPSPTPYREWQPDDSYYYGAAESPYEEDYNYHDAPGRPPKSRQHSDEIPLRENPRQLSDGNLSAKDNKSQREQGVNDPNGQRERRSPGRRREADGKPRPKKGFFSRARPWCVYGFTLIQLVVFIVELVRNSELTSSPIEIHPQINPMLGPSFAVLINMGARYVPCMKNVSGIPVDTAWPCPNTTSLDPNDPSNRCNIAELCGFQDFGNNPNQWFRFITPIFIHAGFVHIGFNLLLQLTLGQEIERVIGSIRFLVVYMSSGIFGFVLGGNFAAPGIASMGASGGLFGIIAINLLDLLYTWNERVAPKRHLAFILLDIAVSFVLGLLPGLDNFSHIGGFLMGLILGICILHSPNLLRGEKAPSVVEPTVERSSTKKQQDKRAKRVSYKSFAKDPAAFFRGRKALWWVWWLVRAGALLGVLVAFIVLLNNFYKYHDTCSWCKYLSCINVNNWCDMGNLTAQINQTSAPKPTNAPALLLRGPGPVDLTPML